MLMEALRWLREAGVAVEAVDVQPSRLSGTRPGTILALTAGDRSLKFAVEERRRAPYPNELPRMSAQRADAHPLLVVPYVPEPLGRALTAAGWSWADAQGNFDLRAPALILRQRRTTTAPKRRLRSLPQGSGSLAIIRALIRFEEGEEEELGATALAAQARVSQPRASQVLRHLRELGLVERSERGRWRPIREPLLDRFLAEYVGPRGSELHYYSLDPPIDVVVMAARALTPPGRLAVSADVGPDLIAAWRRPSLVILYADNQFAASGLGLVEAQGRADANVIVRVPDDRSVFPVPELVVDVRDVEVQLADPSQMIWDLQELGGRDRAEGAGVLREWLLTRP